MIGMFWAEKYMMVSGLTLVVRKLFRLKGKRDMWVSALVFGMAVISMNLGAGLLYPYTRSQYLFGIAEGIFAGNAVALLWMIGKRLFVKKKKKKKGGRSVAGRGTDFSLYVCVSKSCQSVFECSAHSGLCGGGN